MIVLEAKPPVQIGPNRWTWSGTVRTDTLVVLATFDITQRVTPEKAIRQFAGPFALRGDTNVAGFWDSWNQAVNHPAAGALMAAVSMIPGAGQVAAPALAAARAVGVIAKDITAAQVAEAVKRRKLQAMAEAAAKVTNAGLAKEGINVRVGAGDMQRALIARALAPKITPQTFSKLAQQRFLLGSEGHKNLVAVQAAMAALGRLPETRLQLPEASIWPQPGQGDEEDEVYLNAA